MIVVRPSSAADGPALQEIEREAGEQFRTVGLDDVAEHAPASLAELADYAAAGRGWTAVDDGGQPIGYALVDIVDGTAHIEQVSVRPEHQGVGVGRALLDEVRRWARQRGDVAITLTTFVDVPWNRPLYEHLGYRVLADSEIGPELRSVRDAETAHGLDPTTRVCMRLDLEGGVRRGSGGP